MARQRHIPKGRPLMAGTVLLILLAAVVLASGRIINGIAVQMSGRIVTQISQYHTGSCKSNSNARWRCSRRRRASRIRIPHRRRPK